MLGRGLAAGVGALLLGVTGPAALASHASYPGCVAAGVRAIKHDRALTTLPPACRGLPPVAVERAAATAIDESSDHGAKVSRRHLAAQAEAKLSFLIDFAETERATRPHVGPSKQPAAQAAPQLSVPIGVAALVTWLLTAASGGYLLAGWLAHGGLRNSRAGRGRSPPVVLLHFGLALAGLITWTCYQLTAWVALAWIAAVLLLPVTGLGIGSLLLAIPDPARPASTRARPPVVVISVHGTCATLTLLIVLLAAIQAR